jgi:hypothetical protein
VNYPVDFNGAAPDKVKNKIGFYGKNTVTKLLEFLISGNPANFHPCEK